MDITATTLPDYERPPIAEVACGVRFEPIKGFTLPHSGLYWNTIRTEFPECQHAEPLLDPGMSVDLKTGFPLPRIWFLAPEKSALIQLQTNCFFYNWRKLTEDDTYPRFQVISRRFGELFSGLNSFLQSSDLPRAAPTLYELTYVNHIPRGEGWSSMEDLGNLLVDVKWNSTKARFLPVPTGISWQARFPMSSDACALNVRLVQATRTPDSITGLRLELQAVGNAKERSDKEMNNWFALAHEWIVRGFEDLTELRVQQEIWRKTSASK